MKSMGPRKGAAPAGTILMLVAFAAMAGFIYWLSISAEPTDIQIQPAEEVEQRESELLRITTDSFAVDPSMFVGQRVRLINLQSTNLISGEIFTVGLDALGDYVIRMGEGPVSEGLVIFPGDNLHLNGTVRAMDQAEADSLVASGGIGEGQQEAVMINATYIVASEIELLDPEGGQ